MGGMGSVHAASPIYNAVYSLLSVCVACLCSLQGCRPTLSSCGAAGIRIQLRGPPLPTLPESSGAADLSAGLACPPTLLLCERSAPALPEVHPTLLNCTPGAGYCWKALLGAAPAAASQQ
jgi:hypothetical protein